MIEQSTLQLLGWAASRPADAIAGRFADEVVRTVGLRVRRKLSSGSGTILAPGHYLAAVIMPVAARPPMTPIITAIIAMPAVRMRPAVIAEFTVTIASVVAIVPVRLRLRISRRDADCHASAQHAEGSERAQKFLPHSYSFQLRASVARVTTRFASTFRGGRR